MHARTIAILLSCTALLAFSGCSLFRGTPESSRPGAEIALTNHHPVSIQNYRAARSYSAEGRLELAREHYLLAYAAAEDDPPLRDLLERELRAIDLMIKTMR